MDIKTILNKYDKNNITIAVLGSHSALDVCRGAKNLGFKTLVITEIGRGTPYSKYYKTDGQLGCVDEILELESFKDILSEENQEILRSKNAIFIPHRSFEVYINDYNAIENKFNVPMFGNRKLLRSEERGSDSGLDQYKIMDKAGIRYPKQFKNTEDIDRLVIVKVLEKERGFERAFFLAKNEVEFRNKIEQGIEAGNFTQDQVKSAVIEEFLIGVQVNFNFFYDSINERLELMGTDTRRQTNLEGFSKIVTSSQNWDQIIEQVKPQYEESGHIAVTVLESMLEKAFEIGEKFVKATQDLEMPVIGPFGLQSMIIPGPPKKDIIVFDVSPRMPGSPGISATPYSGYLYGESLSAGKRVAMQIKDALGQNKLEEVLT